MSVLRWWSENLRVQRVEVEEPVRKVKVEVAPDRRERERRDKLGRAEPRAEGLAVAHVGQPAARPEERKHILEGHPDGDARDGPEEVVGDLVDLVRAARDERPLRPAQPVQRDVPVRRVAKPTCEPQREALGEKGHAEGRGGGGAVRREVVRHSKVHGQRDHGPHGVGRVHQHKRPGLQPVDERGLRDLRGARHKFLVDERRHDLEEPAALRAGEALYERGDEGGRHWRTHGHAQSLRLGLPEFEGSPRG